MIFQQVAWIWLNVFLNVLIYLLIYFTFTLDLADAIIPQKHQIEYTAKCNMFSVPSHRNLIVSTSVTISPSKAPTNSVPIFFAPGKLKRRRMRLQMMLKMKKTMRMLRKWRRRRTFFWCCTRSWWDSPGLLLLSPPNWASLGSRKQSNR